ncbi:hypothetical protein JW979_04165 [bacterium]|nr:hypothetical protein [candidate division CSSED10-310 bacterium]
MLRRDLSESYPKIWIFSLIFLSVIFSLWGYRITFRIAFDIEVMVKQILPLHQQSTGNIAHWVWTDVPGRAHFFRPTTPLFYTVFYQLFSYHYLPYKLFLLFCHIWSGLMIFIFIKALFNDSYLASLTTGFFIIWPVHGASVVWMNGEDDVFFACFAFTAMATSALMLTRNSRIMGVFSIAAAMGALLSKETALIIPLIMLLVAGITPSSCLTRPLASTRPGTVHVVRFALPYFMLTAGYVIIRHFQWSADWGYQDHGICRHLTTGTFIWTNMGRLVATAAGFDHSHLSSSICNFLAFLPLILVVSPCSRSIKLASMFFIIACMPFINLDVEPVRQYWAGFATALILAESFRWVFSRHVRRIWSIVLPVCCFFVVSLWSHHYLSAMYHPIIRNTALSYGLISSPSFDPVKTAIVILDPEIQAKRTNKKGISLQVHHTVDPLYTLHLKVMLPKHLVQKIHVVDYHQLSESFNTPNIRYFIWDKNGLRLRAAEDLGSDKPACVALKQKVIAGLSSHTDVKKTAQFTMIRP